MTNDNSAHTGKVAAQALERSEHAAWRKSQREILIASRLAVSASMRKQIADEVAGVLDGLIDAGSSRV